MGALYRVFGARQLSAGYRYTTVAGSEVDKAEIRVKRWRIPHRRPPTHRMVGARWPGLAARLPGGGERIRPPEDLATLGVQGSNAATDAKLTTGDADIEHPVVVDRCAGNGVAILPLLDRGLPHHRTSLGIQGHDIGIELAEKHHSLTQRYATVDPAAADGRDLLVNARPVLPEDLTGLSVHRKGVIVARNQVDVAMLDDRRDLM